MSTPTEPWQTKSSADVLSELNTTKAGLSEVEAKQRLQTYGENRLVQHKKKTNLTIFLNQFRSVLIFILVLAAIVSAVIGFYTHELENYVDSVVILIIVIVNAALGFFQEHKAENALAALEKLSAPAARVLRGGVKTKLSSIELVPGDVILLEVGDRVPADARIMESWNLHIDESALTGESIPTRKSMNALTEPDLPVADRHNILFSNTLVTQGRATAVIVSTGMKTEIGKIATLLEDAEPKETPLQKKLASVGRTLGGAIVIISIVIFALESFRGGNYIEAFLVAVSLAVAAVPEGLPAVITISLAIGLERMAKRRAIVRQLPAVETLGATTVICSDKTGTLTRGEMTIRQVYLNGVNVTVSGQGYDPAGEFLASGSALTNDQHEHLNRLAIAGFLCNNADLVHDGNWDVFGDPTEGALIVLAEKVGLKRADLSKNHPRKHENEFDSDRKCMSTIHEIADGSLAVFAKGAPEVLLNKCSKIYKNGKIMPITKVHRDDVLNRTQGMASDALRVLAIAYRPVSLKNSLSFKNAEEDLILLGVVGMIDPPRKVVKEAIQTCRTAGIRPVMITGDHKITAEAIAKELGMLVSGRVVEGSEIEGMSDQALYKLVPTASVFARVSPEHKVRILQAFQANGEVVAMTGDGVNDAPALKNADIGIAMGLSGTDVAREASDMVLQDDNFSTIVNAIEEGRSIYDNIKKFINYMLTANAGEILVIFIAALIGLPLPLVAVQILWINLLTDGFPAVALALDPPAPGIMRRKPRDPDEPIFSKELIISVLFVGTLMAAGALYLFYDVLQRGFPIETARSVVLATLVVLEIVRIQAVRSEYDESFFSNKYLFVAILSSLALLLSVLYIPTLQALFKTTALPLDLWLSIFGVTAVIAVLVEAKLIIQRRVQKQQ